MRAHLQYFGHPVDWLPEIAAWALAEGCESEAMRDLAASSELPVPERWRLYYQAIEQAGLPKLEAETASKLVVRDLAQRIVDGRIGDPYRGARLLYGHLLRTRSAEALTWLRCVYAVEENPDDAQAREAIVEEARRLLAP